MKRIQWEVLAFSLIVFSVGVFAAQERKNVNPGFDFSGVVEFWNIVDILKADKEPTEVQWRAIFETPGYAELIKIEFKPQYFQNIMRAVYMPSQKSLETKIIQEDQQKGGFFAWYTPLVIEGFRNAERDREWIQARVKELQTYPYLKKASEEALKFLPEEKAKDYPKVAFIIFNDSRGYIPLIIGLSKREDFSATELHCLVRQGRDRSWPFLLKLAHESFHFYRDKKLEFDFPDKKSPDYSILWIINQIESEGIADQINRKQLYYGNGCFTETQMAERLRREQAEQPEIMLKMDALFTKMEDRPEAVGELGKELVKLIPQSGHPTGFYMTNIILGQFGKKPLVDVVRNPFKFFYLYNEAAKKDKRGLIFSEKSIRFIESLERKYAGR